MTREKAKLSVNSGKISENRGQISGNPSPISGNLSQISGNESEMSKTSLLHMHMLQTAQCPFKVHLPKVQTHPSLLMAIGTLQLRIRDQNLEIETLDKQNRPYGRVPKLYK